MTDSIMSDVYASRLDQINRTCVHRWRDGARYAIHRGLSGERRGPPCSASCVVMAAGDSSPAEDPVRARADPFEPHRLASRRPPKPGVMLGTDVNPGVHVRELTSDSIRHFASASGDDNPLWCDPHHAHAAGYPAVLAPPMIVFAHSLGPAIAGLRDMTASGSSWGLEFHRRLYCGETLQSRARFICVEPGNGPGGIGASFELEVWNQDLDLLVTMRGTTGAPSAAGLHQGRGSAGASPPRYTQAELAAIERAVRSERRRGDEALQVNPPRPGEQIGPIVKGPLVLGDFVHWYGACGPDCLAGPTSRERAVSSIEP